MTVGTLLGSESRKDWPHGSGQEWQALAAMGRVREVAWEDQMGLGFLLGVKGRKGLVGSGSFLIFSPWCFFGGGAGAAWRPWPA